MAKGHVRYFRNGRQITSDEALEDGVIKDGVSTIVPTFLADSARVRQEPVKRVFAADADQLGLHRPGYRFLDAGERFTDVANRARAISYALYDQEISERWRGTDALGVPAEGSPCTCKGEDDVADFGAPGHIRGGRCVPDRRADARRVPEPDDSDDDEVEAEKEGATTHTERGAPSEEPYRRRRSSDQQTVKDHATKMAALYDAYDKNISQKWRTR